MFHLEDAHFAWRLVRRRPGFAAAALLSLALGIGLNSATVALLDALLWRPFRVESPATTVAVYGTLRQPDGEFTGARGFSRADFLDYERETDFFEGLALWQWQPIYRTDIYHRPEKLVGTFVGGSYFEILGLDPQVGRLLEPTLDNGGGQRLAVVLSDRMWRSGFAADEAVLGHRLRLNGVDFEVVGVAPAGFHGLDLNVSSDLFLPVDAYPRIGSFRDHFDDRSVALFHIFGRLEDGIGADEASTRLQDLTRELVKDLPSAYDALGARAVPLSEAALRPADRRRYATYGRSLAVASGLLLFVACFNVANLLLLRDLERGKALAVRSALGADRWRLARQLSTENLLIFGAGGLLALPVAYSSLKLFWFFRPVQFGQGVLEPRIGALAMAWSIGSALVLGLLFGLLPAFRASRFPPMRHLRNGPATSELAGHRISLRRVLVTAQVALAFAALSSGVLFCRSLQNARSLDLGFEPEKLLVLSIAPGLQGYEPPRVRELYRQIREEALSVPGVVDAAWSENRLLRGGVIQRQIFLPGATDAALIGERDYHRTNVVGPGFFETVGLELLHGRDFDLHDTGHRSGAAIVNRSMARTLWPDDEALGQMFYFDDTTTEPLEIVGVVEDARYREIREEDQFFIYLPMSFQDTPAMTLHVKTRGDPADEAPAVTARIRWLAPDLVTSDVAAMQMFVDQALWAERTGALLLSAFAALALSMAALGIYLTVAFSTLLRATELELRSALGASPKQLVWPAVARAGALVFIGLGLGWLLAVLWIEPVLASQLHDVRASAPLLIALATLPFIAIGAAGSWYSARKVVRFASWENLRND